MLPWPVTVGGRDVTQCWYTDAERDTMKSPRREVRFDVISLLLIIFGVGLIAFLAGRQQISRQLQPYVAESATELRLLEDAYGPSRNSEHGEEWIVRDFFKGKRDGIFIDIGANDYRRFSNTYYLETELGWSGVAIEPQTKFAEDYARFRPRTTFVPLFVSNVSNQEAVLFVPSNDLVASSSREFAEQRGGGAPEMQRALTTTLDDILTRLELTRIDFLTMDIELAEPDALAGFTIQRFKPALVCIEAHLPIRNQILEYFARNAYVLAGQYLRADSHNLWFVPLSS